MLLIACLESQSNSYSRKKGVKSDAQEGYVTTVKELGSMLILKSDCTKGDWV